MMNTKYKLGLFLNSSPQYGGTFQYNISILNAFSALDQEKYEKTVVYGYPEWQGILENYRLDTHFLPQKTFSRCIDYATRIFGLDMDRCRLLSKMSMPYRRSLVAMNCDLWVFPSQDPHSYECRLKSLVSILDLMHRYERGFPESSSWHSYKNRETLYKNICRHSFGILVDSEVGKKQVIESYNADEEKVFVLPYTPPAYIYDKVDKTEIAIRYGLPNKFFFYPAQFWSHKNHRNLIRGFRLVSDKLPDFKLVLSGHKKHCYKEVQKLVIKLGLEEKVLFVDYVPSKDIRGFYENATAMIMPSFFGPTNIPPLEALVCGCPIAVSDIYANREQLGKASLYFNPGSVEEIAGTLVALTNESIRNSLVEAERTSRHKFPQDLFNTRLASIVESILLKE